MRRFVTSKAGFFVLQLLAFSLLIALIIKEDASNSINIEFLENKMEITDRRVEGDSHKISIDILCDGEKKATISRHSSPGEMQRVNLSQYHLKKDVKYKCVVYDISSITKCLECILLFSLLVAIWFLEREKK